MTKDYEEEKKLLLQIPVEQEYEKQTLKNDFIFGKVMQDPKLCIELLELLTGNEIDGIESINSQKPVKVTNDSKGVRYDIYVEDKSNNVYDTEMQQYWGMDTKKELPRRSRYYQGLVDLNLLESGGDYGELKNSYVVFICTFDPFDMDLCCYKFENMCMAEPILPLGDGRRILIFNSKGIIENVSEDVKKFLDYLETNNANNEFTKKLDNAVKIACHNKEWKVEYMKSLLYEMDIRRRATKEGLAEGRAEGRGKYLIEQIVKKVKKGKKVEVIAEELEAELDEVKETYEIVLEAGPDYDIDEIYYRLVRDGNKDECL